MKKVPLKRHLEELVAGRAQHPPVAELVGYRWTCLEPDRATVELTVRPGHANLMGTVHGGIFCVAADAAMGGAYATGLADDEVHTTLELKINFLRPVWRGRLTAKGKVIKRGRRVGLCEAEVFDHKGRLVAKASGTLMTLRGDDAQRRREIPPGE